MTKEQYLALRAKLFAEAEALIDEGKMEDYAAKEQEIKDLDVKFEAIGLAQANMNALRDKPVATDVQDMQVDNTNVAAAVTTTSEPKDEKEQYRDAWAKVMMGQKLQGGEAVLFDTVNTEFKNAVQTANTHAVLIPESVTENIWKEAADMFPILADLDMTFVPGDLTILKETDSGDDAAWYDEDTEVDDGDFTIGELNLTGCELAKSVPISWKLRKMSIERFIPYITGLLAEKMGAALAKGIVSGKGKPGAEDTFKPEPKGIITALDAEANTPQIIEYAAANGIVYDTMTLAMAVVKSSYKSGAAIYAKSTVIWGKLAQIKDEQGRPLFIPDVTANGIGRMFGLLVKEDDSVPDDAVLIGNVRRGYAVNVNENMTIYTEDHIKKRYTDYMDYAIVDGAPLTTKAFALIREELPVS